MDGEECRDESASPQRSGQFPQSEKQNDCRQAVQQNIREMMPARVESVDLAVGHVRNRGQRMPVIRMHMSEGPENSVEAQTIYDDRIIVDVIVVVIIQELMPNRLCKNHPDE